LAAFGTAYGADRSAVLARGDAAIAGCGAVVTAGGAAIPRRGAVVTAGNAVLTDRGAVLAGGDGIFTAFQAIILGSRCAVRPRTCIALSCCVGMRRGGQRQCRGDGERCGGGKPFRYLCGAHG